jgi:flavin reductase (DIM6/NTAB) family NADH-FMN oxidoreductase RutF
VTNQDSFARTLRDALGQFATGVTIITTVKPDGRPAGITVNSFTSVSLEPPLVLWNLGRYSANWDAFESAEHFAVNVLAADQADVALNFAEPGRDPFTDMSFDNGAGGVPLLPGAIAQFECRLAERRDGGDHITLVGEVLAHHDYGGEPLLFHRGRFGRFTPA